MNYPAFTNDSLTMMYEASARPGADDAAEKQGDEPDSEFARHPIGRSTRRSLDLRGSNAECFRSHLIAQGQGKLPFGIERTVSHSARGRGFRSARSRN